MGNGNFFVKCVEIRKKFAIFAVGMYLETFLLWHTNIS